jgi:hypothetical protein
MVVVDPSFACAEPVTYKTVITENDIKNSAGKNLNTLGGLVRQDRANYHKFLLRDVGDEGDPVLFDEKKRAALEEAVNRSDPNYDFVDPFYWDADPGTKITVTFWHCESPPRALVKLPDPPTAEENEAFERLLRRGETKGANPLKALPPPP